MCRFRIGRGGGDPQKAPRGHIVCGACGVGLCLTRGRNCFRDFHTVEEVS